MRIRVTEGKAVIYRELTGSTPLTLGRQVDSDVRLASETCSRRHARIVFDQGSWWLQDLKSRIGTVVDGKRIETVPLRAGMRAVLGKTVTLEVLESPASESAPSAPRREVLLVEYRGGEPGRLLPRRVPGSIPFKGAGGQLSMMEGDEGSIVLALDGLSSESLGLAAFPKESPLSRTAYVVPGGLAALYDRKRDEVPLYVFGLDRERLQGLPSFAAKEEAGRHEPACRWECGPDDLYCPGCGAPLGEADVRLYGVSLGGPACGDDRGTALLPSIPAYVWQDECAGALRVSASPASSRLQVENGADLVVRGKSLIEAGPEAAEVALSLTEEGTAGVAQGTPVRIALVACPTSKLASPGGATAAPPSRYVLVIARRPRLLVEAAARVVVWPEPEHAEEPWRVALHEGDVCLVRVTLAQGTAPPVLADDAWIAAAPLAGEEENREEPAASLHYRVLPDPDGWARVALRWVAGQSHLAGGNADRRTFLLTLPSRLQVLLSAETYRPPVRAKVRSLDHPAEGDPQCRMPFPVEVSEPVTIEAADVRLPDGSAVPWARVLTAEGTLVKDSLLRKGTTSLLLEIRGRELAGRLATKTQILIVLRCRRPWVPIEILLELRDPVPFEAEADYLSIDFGTTTTCCAYSAARIGGQPTALQLGRTGPEIPSAIYFEDVSDRMALVYVIGEDAVRRVSENPCGFISGWKRPLLEAGEGKMPTFWVRDRNGIAETFSGEYLMTLYFRAVVRRAQDEYARKMLEKTKGTRKLRFLNLTYPVGVQKSYRELLQRVGRELDGFDGVLTTREPQGVLVRLDEASAGAIGTLPRVVAGPSDLNRERIVFLLDSGGGTVEVVLLAFRGDPVKSPQLRVVAAARMDDIAGESLTAAIAQVLRRAILVDDPEAGLEYPWQDPGQVPGDEEGEAGIHNARVLRQIADWLKTDLLGDPGGADRKVDLTEPSDQIPLSLLARDSQGERVAVSIAEAAANAAERGECDFDVRCVSAGALERATGWRQRLGALWRLMDRMVRLTRVSRERIERILLIGRGGKLRMLQESAREGLPWLCSADKATLWFEADRAKSCVPEGAARFENRGNFLTEVLAWPLRIGPADAGHSDLLLAPGRVRFVRPEELQSELAAPTPQGPPDAPFQWEAARWFPIPRMGGEIAIYLDLLHQDDGPSGPEEDAYGRIFEVCRFTLPEGGALPIRGFLVREDGKTDHLELYDQAPGAASPAVVVVPLTWTP